jgi:hypothetical protein
MTLGEDRWGRIDELLWEGIDRLGAAKANLIYSLGFPCLDRI